MSASSNKENLTFVVKSTGAAAAAALPPSIPLTVQAPREQKSSLFTFYDAKPERSEMDDWTKPTVSEVTTLVLAQFQAIPVIDFGSVLVNLTRAATLAITNPSSTAGCSLSVERFPFESGFSCETVSFQIPPKQTVQTTVTWTPASAGGCRESILLNLDGKHRLKVTVYGVGVEPKKKKSLHDQFKKPPSAAGKQPSATKPATAKARTAAPTPLSSAASALASASNPDPRVSQKRIALPPSQPREPSAAAHSRGPSFASSDDYQQTGFVAWMNHFFAHEDHQGSFAHKRQHALLREKAAALRSSLSFANIESKVVPAITIRADVSLFADLGVRKSLTSLLFQYNLQWLHIGLEAVFDTSLPHPESVSQHVTAVSRFLLSHFLFDERIAAQFSVSGIPNYYREGFRTTLNTHTLTRFLQLVLFLDAAKSARLLPNDPCLFRVTGRSSSPASSSSLSSSAAPAHSSSATSMPGEGGADITHLTTPSFHCTEVTDADRAPIKSSRDVLYFFSRHFLSGEGDFLKHLSFLGYRVSHTQSYLDEFDFSVVNLSTDLCDGIRLTRLAELLTQDFSLSAQLRVPVVSPSQKLHNVEVALQAFARHGIAFSELRGGGIQVKDIVSGHREKTLALLWKLLFHFRVEILVNESQLQEELEYIQQRLPARLVSTECDELSTAMYFTSNGISLLLKWAQLICLNYNILVKNFTSSFSDGRVFCYLLHYYLPSFLPRSLIREQTPLSRQLALSASDSDPHPGMRADSDETDGEPQHAPANGWVATFSPRQTKYATKREAVEAQSVRENFRLLHQKVSELGGVPLMIKPSEDLPQLDEKVVISYVSYLSSRLIDIAKEQRAKRATSEARRMAVLILGARMFLSAVRIQRCFRAFLDLRFALAYTAAVKIQAAVRMHLARRKYLALRRAIVRLQALVRGRQQRRVYALALECSRRRASALARAARMFLAAVTIQRCRRSLLARRFALAQAAALKIQTCFRKHRQQREYRRARSAAILVQSQVRGYLQRKAYIALRHQTAHRLQKLVLGGRLFLSAVRVQRWYRSCRAQRLALMHSSATKIQALFRMRTHRKQFSTLRTAAIVLQSCFRGRQQRRLYHSLQAAAAHRQRVVSLAACMFVSAVRIQRAYKRALARRLALAHAAACTIQSAFRRFAQRQRFCRIRAAAIALQSHFRGLQARRAFAQLLECVARRNRILCIAARMFTSAVCIQRRYRACRAARFALAAQSATAIQSAFRGFVCRRNYAALRNATVTLQARFRGAVAQRSFTQLRAATVRCQALVRGRQQRARYHQLLVQSAHRLRTLAVAATMFISAVRIQRAFRAHEARRVARANAAATRIQCCFRRFACQRDYLRRKSAATLLQSLYRGRAARREYRLLCAAAAKRARVLSLATRVFMAAVAIQRCFRAHLERRFLHVTRAATIIQSAFRGCVCRRSYLSLRRSAVLLQSQYRGLVQRRRFQQQLACIARRTRALCLGATIFLSAVKIQRAVRAWEQRRLALAERSATRIQACFRAYAVRQQYSRLLRATIFLQSLARGRQQRQEYARLRQLHARRARVLALAASMFVSSVRIQRYFRAHVARRIAGEHSAATRIQAWYKARVCAGRYLAMKRAAVALQARYRGHLQRVRYEQLVAQSAHRLQAAAAVKVQSAWRGYTARKRTQAELAQITRIRQRLAEANSRVKEHLKIGNRTHSALDVLLKSKNMSYILKACSDLDAVTGLSAKCCETMVGAHSAVPIVFSLILNCNRSQPHLEVLKHALNILIHLSVCPTTVQSVFSQPNSINIIAELVQIYRDKEDIFKRACKLLIVLCSDDARAAQVRKMASIVERLKTIQAALQKRHSLEQRLRNPLSHAMASVRASTSANAKSSPKALRRVNHLCEKLSSLHEIELLVNILSGHN